MVGLTVDIETDSGGHEVCITELGIAPVSEHRCETAVYQDFGTGKWKREPDLPDPWAYVLSVNAARRHLTAEQKREVIAKLLKAQPGKSNRQIAEMAKDEHKKVGRVRADLEARGVLPHVEATTDTKGRQQPTKKAKRGTVANIIAERKPPHIVLPSAKKLVAEIMARDAAAQGYTKAVLQGLVDAIGGPHLVPGVYQVAHALLCALAKKAGNDAGFRKLCDGEDIDQSFVDRVVDDVEAKLNASAPSDDLAIPDFLRRTQPADPEGKLRGAL
jgi:hypothetical protein